MNEIRRDRKIKDIKRDRKSGIKCTVGELMMCKLIDVFVFMWYLRAFACCCNIWLDNGGTVSNMSKSSNVSNVTNATTVASSAVQSSGILNHIQSIQSFSFFCYSLVDIGLQRYPQNM